MAGGQGTAKHGSGRRETRGVLQLPCCELHKKSDTSGLVFGYSSCVALCWVANPCDTKELCERGLCHTVETLGCVGESFLGKVEQSDLRCVCCVDGLAKQEL